MVKVVFLVSYVSPRGAYCHRKVRAVDLEALWDRLDDLLPLGAEVAYIADSDGRHYYGG